MFNSGISGYSLSDVAAVTGGSRNNDGGWGEGGAWWIIILFLFVFCGWGNGGWSNGGAGGATGQALTRGELCQDMNFADLETAVRGVQSGLCDGFYAMNTGMLNGFSSTNAAIAAGFAGVDNAVCTLGYQTQQGINSINTANMQNTFALQQAINGVEVNNMQNTNALQTQIAQCCCDNKAALADIKYTMATDTCALQTSLANATRDMIDVANANTRSILDFLVQNKISDLENENQALRLSASQQAQNNYLINALRPAPVPAFNVPAPYQFYGCNNIGAFANGCC